MKINLEELIKQMMGIKDQDIEQALIKSGFIYEYEVDNYVSYKGKKIKVLYDTQNKCIVGYREL
jgi:hypothetical protein